MRTSVRLWHTEKDGELVPDGDPKAVTLAYGVDDEVENRDQAAAEKHQPKKAKADGNDGDKSQGNDGDKSQKAPAKKAAAKKAAPKGAGRVH